MLDDIRPQLVKTVDYRCRGRHMFKSGARELYLMELQEIVEACGSSLTNFCKRYERAAKP